MTPKEKAEELHKKFKLSAFTVRDNEAKRCALICVDEVISNLDLIHKPEYVSILIDDDYIDIYQAIEYYNEVKLEIEKL